MIAFATLLLGIAFGTETIELTVGDAVTRVALVLDGREVASLEAPPWRAAIDLGPRPRPHQLIAIAFDAEGSELGRAEQWLNLPQPAAETSLVIEPRPEGGTVARLSWESLAGVAPVRVDASFDGEPLAVSDPRAIVLPAYDDAALHFLRIELFFSETVSALVERTLGGTYTDSVATELTAIPIETADGDAPAAAALAGRLTAAGRPLSPVAIEDDGPAIVVLVVDRQVFPRLQTLIANRLSTLQRSAGPGWLALDRRHRLRFLWPVPQRQAGAARAYDLFNLSETFDAGVDGVFFLMRNVQRPLYVDRGAQRLADAVANAGLEADSRRRVRAVVLVLGAEPEDASLLRPEQVRPYLADLQVPLVVWSTDARPAAGPWGEPRSIANPLRLEGAVKDLVARLRRQHIVWVEGTHLPQDIALGSAEAGAAVRLVR